MNEVFGAGDLLGSLVELERTGHEFYLRMSQQAGDEKIRRLFRFMAGEEARHEKIYAGLAAEFRDGAPAGDADADYQAYLKVLVSQNFRFDPDGIRTMEEAMRFAVSLEKDTLIYIGEVQTILKGQRAELFETIKKEERNHLRMLAEYAKQE